MTIVEFLTARLAEDEQRGNNWREVRDIYDEPCPQCGRGVNGWGSRMDGAPGVSLTHIHLNDIGCDLTPDEWREFADGGPADEAVRLLREVAAKRAIVELAAAVEQEMRNLVGTMAEPLAAGRKSAMDVALRALASVYADHPDYDPTWTAGAT